MKCTSGLYAFVSVLALACSGSSNSGGAGGAGGGAMAAQQPPQQATTASGVKLGGDPPPKNPAGDPSNASGNVASSTQPPPSNPSEPPASSTDQYPSEGIAGVAGGGNCDDICAAAGKACPEAASTENQQQCRSICAAAMASGCLTQMGVLLSCTLGLGCAQGFDHIDNSIEAACGAQIAQVQSCDANLLDSVGGMTTTVQPDQGGGAAGAGSTPNDVITQACNSACQIAVIGNCAPGGDQASCVQSCTAQGQAGPAAVVAGCQ
jgi:hypothetical protein